MSQRNNLTARVVRGLQLMAIGLAATIALPAQAPADSAKTGTLTDYLAGGQYNGSTIGNYTVAADSFNALNSGISADDITVTPVSIGLQFTLPGFTGGAKETNLEISWTITDFTGAASINLASLAMTEYVANGTGVVKITDQTLGLMTSVGAGTNTTASTTAFNPVTTVTFSDLLSAQIGFQAGQAQIMQYTDTITIPEPSSLLLATFGALGVVTMVTYHRRRWTLRKAAGIEKAEGAHAQGV